MKKLLFSTLLLTAFVYSRGQQNLGVIAGGVLARTSGKTSAGRFGGYLGLETEFKLGKLVSLRPQLKYVMKGENISAEGKGGYNYIELPINFVYYIPTKVGRFSVGAGPALAYMMSGTWTALDGKKEGIDFNYDKVNRFDFGLNAVANFEVSSKLFFSINYTLGLIDVWTADYVRKNANRVIGFGVGLKF